MPWKPLPSVAFAICTYPFRAAETDDLPLQIGDHIYIIEQGGSSNDWYRGYLVAPPSLLAGLTSDRGQQLEHRVFSGIFPRNCVEVREYLGQRQDAVVDDAADTNGQHEAENGDYDMQPKHKSQALHARKMSKRVSRTKSLRSIHKKTKSILVPDEPVPRDPNVPKPLAPVPLLRVGDETGLSAAEPLVDEIASCMREWHEARLHELLLARGYNQLVRMQDLIKRVDNSRNQLMHDVLTIRELAALREDTVWDLVAGNKMLDDEIIVRSPTQKGRILTAEDSVVEMTMLQANMSILDRPPKPVSDKHMLYHMLVDVRNLVYDSDQPATLQMALLSKEFGEAPRPVSESYAIAIPIPATPTQTTENQTKSLFVNLSNLDIGIGVDMKSLFVVFKLLRDEPVRQLVHGQGVNHQHQQKPSLLSGINTDAVPTVKGRRSVFGSQKRNDSHRRAPSSLGVRPSTSLSQHSEQTDGQSGSSNTEALATGDTKTVRRVIGVGAVDITKVAQAKGEVENTITLWAPSSSADDRSDEGDDWHDISREVLRSQTGGFARLNMIKRLDVVVKAFAASDVDTLVRNTPQLLHDVLMTPKLGFSGLPGEKRSDIYLTLSEPLLSRNATLAHSKFGAVPLNQRCQTSLANLQLTLEVRKANGERIDDCIFTASNHQGHTAWRTTGIERGEAWNQTIRLAVPAEQVPGCHVVMSIADSPNFPFALAWVPLWEDEAFVRDGDHQVALYVYDEYSSSIIGGKGAYLALPPWHDKTDPAQQNGATISLRTFLCSTEYSQDPTLLGVLHWSNYHGEQLLELLERFPFVPEIETVKLLRDVFGALFEILHEYATMEEYEDLVFYNFVVILSIARDKRFGLGDIIEDFATTRHDWPNASQCLIRAYQRLVSSPMDPEASRKLRATFKVGDQILKLIVETSREPAVPESYDEQTNGTVQMDRSGELLRELQKLFVAIMALLRNPMPVLLGTQTLLVQHFHSWLPELESLMSPAEILEIATDLVDSSSNAKGKMILYRLILVANYSSLELFKLPETRTILLANTFRWLEPFWGQTSSIDQQWRDQVRLCCSVVAAQMEELGNESCQYVPKLTESFAVLQNKPPPPKRAFSMLFPTTYPFPYKPTLQDVTVDEALLEVSALLAAALTSETKLYFNANQVDVTAVLAQALKVEQSILNCEAFPRSWLSLLVCHHRYGMTALERISELLVESLPDVYAADTSEALDFDTDIWRAYFSTLFASLSSPVLAMETFPEQKRRAVWKIAGDVREVGAKLLKQSWDSIGWDTDEDTGHLHGFEKLGGYQVQFVPEFVAPVVELCLSVHASLRAVAVEVLRSMIVSSWQIDQDLSVIQSAMIDCLDKLCRTKNVTGSVLQKTFVPEMLEHFAPLKHTIEDSLYIAVGEMFSKIDDLLVMLGSVHQSGNNNDASRLVDTLQLMTFLRNVQSEDAYIRYVHQLADMQLASGNVTEAGLALQMHADRYDWDPLQNLAEMADPTLPAQNAFERKEALYFQICQYYEKGKSWKRALATYRELAVQYELNVFDFAKLARAQRAIASIQDRIASGDRYTPRYFRVVYRGLGFPPTLRDKQYIFEGAQTDRLAIFEERMQQLHPQARVLHQGQEPEVEGQFLQIFAVSPNKDLDHMVYQRTKVSQAVRDYSLTANPQKFATTARQPARDVPITEQVVEKVLYTTAEEFPTILRRSEIVSIDKVTLLPIEAAIERTTRKTQELLGLERRTAAGDDEGAMVRLTDDLLSSVDASSDSSVARYHGLLPASEMADNISGEVDPSILEREQSLDSMQSALKSALLDHALAIKRCLGLYKRAEHLATRAMIVPRFEATFQTELATLFPHKGGMIEDASPPSTAGTAQPAAQSQPQQTQAAPGAEEQQDERRTGRRMSLNFLRRGSSRQGRTNGVEEGNEEGRRSRAGSRSGRARSSSRLSFFRNNTETESKEGGERRGSLRRRLSLLNSTSGNADIEG